MSRSNNTELANPSTRWFEWSGSEGKVKWYDRENKENVYVDLPFTFLVLDVLSTVTGYSDAAGSGIWANEIRDIRNGIFTVRHKLGILKEGTWADVKAIDGARFTQSVYIAYKDGKDLKIGNIKLAGSAVGPWLDFRKGKDIYNGAISITKATQEKKGANKYFAPVFETKPTNEDTDAVAKELDQQLQQYLNSYLTAPKVQAAVVNGEPVEYSGRPNEGYWRPGQPASHGEPPEMPPFDPRDDDAPDDDSIPF